MKRIEHRHSAWCIVPPYILEQIARKGTPEQRERAIRTLGADASLRSARIARAARATKQRESLGIGPPNKQRTISNANNTWNLPGTQARAEGQPATGDAAVDEAYDGLGSTFDLYWNV